MARPTPLSGFPEWLPQQRVVEQQILDSFRRTFELHGFAGIQTRSVEPLTELLRKGDTSKEVYVLGRLQGEGEPTESARLGLHFDLTVPLARYVLENAGKLDFPFKRYQIQPAWRGERPQEGRFREFWQADLDVVGDGDLPYHYEVELPLVAAEALGELRRFGVPPVRVLVNNRKVAEGFYRGIGLEAVDEVLRIIDKLGKVGPQVVAQMLAEEAGASPAQAAACLELAAISGSDDGVIDAVRALAQTHGASSDLLDVGLAELGALVTAAARRAPGVVVADLAIARGLDYYTGSVYETVLVGHEDLGSICSGGRYDTLASDGAHTYPGVGLSIGVSRLVSRLISADLVRATRKVPTAVLVAVANEEARATSDAVAAALRLRGIPADVAPTAAKFGKQIRHADRRGIPFVWFPGDDGAPDQVKDIRSGDQVDAEAASWEPPPEDVLPRVEAT
ncbi:histidyl-tRNA synthetase [Beutenbergia cavernae DSM 12333]|uniref:Histidine--tRNA ligase n=1 Tax=Beutenbergia cavernae (strain ATCC BAA-8 / DSM 12333 / CCUG 43141 / JCM 11478 / NBRC 16432 / NCIMB 13614 / HKI 0122) TaxID=471853 RepID=C5C5R7_BEUC1|nr:histidine--tRNA ligase [Beutenbergia cavernae]ACQ80258.1 histidyl-tRNA synthetase [Beutenbergia cavernae DSM 12333]